MNLKSFARHSATAILHTRTSSVRVNTFPRCASPAHKFPLPSFEELPLSSAIDLAGLGILRPVNYNNQHIDAQGEGLDLFGLKRPVGDCHRGVN